ncbi:hypothetical protein C0R02_14785 [Streptomyces albidoflavus]|nr:hypothetical protein C0R02_14785 [Streptomyces albidoflavus]
MLIQQSQRIRAVGQLPGATRHLPGQPGPGVAVADNGSFANDGSNAAVATVSGSGVGDDNSGNSATTQQQAVGSGASNENNSAQVNDSAFTSIDQSDKSVWVSFNQLW